MVTAELIRKVQNVRPERREESEDEAAPLWRSLPSYWSWGRGIKDRYRAEDVEGVGEKVRHMNDLQETGC